MRILLAEDERSLCRALTVLLARNHYTVDAVNDGDAALEYLQGGGYDAVILDWMMPGKDGIQVLRALRERGDRVPVLLLTARSDIDDKVLGLDAGANDYLTKPFSTRELLARLRAMTRAQGAGGDSALRLGNLSLDRAAFTLAAPGGQVRLAGKEYQLMELFLANPGQVWPAERLLERAWGYDAGADVRTVWVYISYLRKKLATLHANVQIRATRGGRVFPGVVR